MLPRRTLSHSNLGICYREGRGCEQSYEKAAEWYEKAALQGQTDAQSALGYLYEQGQGVPKSEERAVELYIQSAAHGNLFSRKVLAVSQNCLM